MWAKILVVCAFSIVCSVALILSWVGCLTFASLWVDGDEPQVALEPVGSKCLENAGLFAGHKIRPVREVEGVCTALIWGQCWTRCVALAYASRSVIAHLGSF